MTLKDLTDPRAVVRAMEECDRVGRSNFLQTHGFGPADEYFLAYKGRFYDSKAIAGAAHLHQTGTSLPNSEFAGGLHGAVPRLRGLDFEIVSQRRGSYVLLWNPTRWEWDETRRQEIRRSIEAGGTGVAPWSTGSRKKDIQVGDRIFLFIVGQSQRGLVASGHAASSIYLDQHWAADHDEPAPKISVAWDNLLDPKQLLPWGEVQQAVPEFRDNYQGGGIKLDGLQTLSLDALWQVHLNTASMPASQEAATPEIEASYSYVIAKKRNHQRQFRSQLLAFYEPKCDVCGFDQIEILEAAHLIPDSQDGPSTVENGRLLCPNHHRAHDALLFRMDGHHAVWTDPSTEFLAPARPARGTK